MGEFFNRERTVPGITFIEIIRLYVFKDGSIGIESRPEYFATKLTPEECGHRLSSAGYVHSTSNKADLEHDTWDIKDPDWDFDFEFKGWTKNAPGPYVSIALKAIDYNESDDEDDYDEEENEWAIHGRIIDLLDAWDDERHTEKNDAHILSYYNEMRKTVDPILEEVRQEIATVFPDAVIKEYKSYKDKGLSYGDGDIGWEWEHAGDEYKFDIDLNSVEEDKAGIRATLVRHPSEKVRKMLAPYNRGHWNQFHTMAEQFQPRWFYQMLINVGYIIKEAK